MTRMLPARFCAGTSLTRVRNKTGPNMPKNTQREASTGKKDSQFAMQHPTQENQWCASQVRPNPRTHATTKVLQNKAGSRAAMPGPWNIEDEEEEGAHEDPAAQRSEARAKQSDEKGNRYHTAPTLHKLICNCLCLYRPAACICRKIGHAARLPRLPRLRNSQAAPDVTRAQLTHTVRRRPHLLKAFRRSLSGQSLAKQSDMCSGTPSHAVLSMAPGSNNCGKY